MMDNDATGIVRLVGLFGLVISISVWALAERLGASESVRFLGGRCGLNISTDIFPWRDGRRRLGSAPVPSAFSMTNVPNQPGGVLWHSGLSSASPWAGPI